MSFKIGQRVVALYDIFIIHPDGYLLKQVVSKDQVFVVENTKDACCVQSVDIGFISPLEHGDLLLYCPKCRKRFEIKYEETIWFWSTWFRSLDNYGKELLRKFFSKRNETRPIKIRTEPKRVISPKTDPPNQKPPEVQPYLPQPAKAPERDLEPAGNKSNKS
jgi:hypothetical protein